MAGAASTLQCCPGPKTRSIPSEPAHSPTCAFDSRARRLLARLAWVAPGRGARAITNRVRCTPSNCGPQTKPRGDFWVTQGRSSCAVQRLSPGTPSTAHNDASHMWPTVCPVHGTPSTATTLGQQQKLSFSFSLLDANSALHHCRLTSPPSNSRLDFRIKVSSVRNQLYVRSWNVHTVNWNLLNCAISRTSRMNDLQLARDAKRGPALPSRCFAHKPTVSDYQPSPQSPHLW